MTFHKYFSMPLIIDVKSTVKKIILDELALELYEPRLCERFKDTYTERRVV